MPFYACVQLDIMDDDIYLEEQGMSVHHTPDFDTRDCIYGNFLFYSHHTGNIPDD